MNMRKGSRGFTGQGPGPRACQVLPGQGKASESEMSDSEVRIPDRSQIIEDR